MVDVVIEIDDRGGSPSPPSPPPPPKDRDEDLPFGEPIPVVPPAPPLSSRVPAFDRPQAVIVMGPRPLPVTIVGERESNRPSPRSPRNPAAPRRNYARELANLAGAGFRAGGAAAAGFAGNAALPALNNAIGVAAQGLSMLGPYGMAAGAGLQAVGSAAMAVKQTLDAFVARGKELIPFSGEIASSAARADVRRLQGDIREAQQLGPQFARLIEAQSKTEATIQRLLEPLKAFFLDRLADFLERGNRTLISILEGLDDLTRHKIAGIRELIEDLKNIMEGNGDMTLLDKWIAPVNGAGPPPAVGPVGGFPLGVPLIFR